MSATTFEDLVRIAASTEAPGMHDECGACEAAIGEPCTLNCDNRGAAARDAVRAEVVEMTGERFREVLKDAREREARDDETPGFFWAWWAVDAEAQARGLDCPVGI
ncbi:hypothetical protein [Streptomyces canus]|uniref:hypothetical protein n=1 Tax=Streptomyces canus TaxID=58343 RepID=UPI00278A3B31|nr:hypothetical protein [Streptomyces canus]MDQ0762041.1 hypothetical protein [Streptomyces canus]